MTSYRCPRCWISFDTRLKVVAHVEKEACEVKGRPLGERFMQPADEEEVERAFGKTPELDIWWAWFRLLVREVENLDDITLMCQYSPCKSSLYVISRSAYRF